MFLRGKYIHKKLCYNQHLYIKCKGYRYFSVYRETVYTSKLVKDYIFKVIFDYVKLLFYALPYSNNVALCL